MQERKLIKLKVRVIEIACSDLIFECSPFNYPTDLSSYRQGDEGDFYVLKFPTKNTPILA